MSATLIGFIVYLLMILIVGFISYFANKSHNDYFIAGRKLNPWVVAFSERASGESAWLLLGLPGAALATGVIEIWTAMGCILGIIFYWLVIARRLREESEKMDAITLPNFFAAKIDPKDKAIRLTATLIILFFFTFYVAAQFNAAGKVLDVTFNLKETTQTINTYIYKFWPDFQLKTTDIGIIIGSTAIIFYTMMGGFIAVAWTDLIQGIIMIGALLILPLAGILELSAQGNSLGNSLTQAGDNFTSLTAGHTGWAAAAIIISGLSWAFGYMGQPHLLTRFMSISNAAKIKTSRSIAFAWAIPAFTGAFLIGIAGIGLYGGAAGFEDVEHVMPHMATDLMPAWIAGIFVSGAIAAMMSTADSQLLVISSSVIEDFYHKTLNKKVTEQTLLQFSRLVTVFIGIFGFIIAVTSTDLVFEMVSYAWSGLGASFGPALLLILLWTKTTKQGILTGMITGSLTTVIWGNIDNLNETISVRFVSFVLAFLAVIIVSLFTQKQQTSG